MFVELLSSEERSQLMGFRAAMTHAILVQVFRVDEGRAGEIVSGMLDRLNAADVSDATRSAFLHEDPLHLAIDLVGIDAGDLTASQRTEVEVFNQTVRPRFEALATGQPVLAREVAG